MRALVIYDTTYGNTRTIAEAIARALGDEVQAVAVADLGPGWLTGIELLVVGSPIIGWKASEKMGAFLDSLGSGQLADVKAAAFDTRVKVFFHGDAMKKIAKELQRAGAEIIAPPQGFNVAGTEGPLLDGEVEKAAEWARGIIAKAAR